MTCCGAIPSGYCNASGSEYEQKKEADDEWFRPLLSSYERMQPRLLRRPSRDRIQIQKALAKVDERRATIKL